MNVWRTLYTRQEVTRVASKCRCVLCVGFAAALQDDRALPFFPELSPGEGDGG